jgi:hypothetical protein
MDVEKNSTFMHKNFGIYIGKKLTHETFGLLINLGFR